jgi:hypothetical protein
VKESGKAFADWEDTWSQQKPEGRGAELGGATRIVISSSEKGEPRAVENNHRMHEKKYEDNCPYERSQDVYGQLRMMKQIYYFNEVSCKD